MWLWPSILAHCRDHGIFLDFDKDLATWTKVIMDCNTLRRWFLTVRNHTEHRPFQSLFAGRFLFFSFLIFVFVFVLFFVFFNFHGNKKWRRLGQDENLFLGLPANLQEENKLMMHDPDWTAELVKDVHGARGVALSFDARSALFYLSNSPAVCFSCISILREFMYPRSTTFLIICSERLLRKSPPLFSFPWRGGGLCLYLYFHHLSVRLDLIRQALLLWWCARLPRYWVYWHQGTEKVAYSKAIGLDVFLSFGPCTTVHGDFSRVGDIEIRQAMPIRHTTSMR